MFYAFAAYANCRLIGNVYAMDFDFAGVVYFHIYDGGDVRQEAAMRGDAERVALFTRALPLAGLCFFRTHQL